MLRNLGWNQVCRTQDCRLQRREKRSTLHIMKDRYEIRDEIISVMHDSFMTTHQIQQRLTHRFPGDLNDALRFFEDKIFQRTRYGRLTAWKKIPGILAGKRPSTTTLLKLMSAPPCPQIIADGLQDFPDPTGHL